MAHRKVESFAVCNFVKAIKYLLDAHLNDNNRYVSVGEQGEFKGLVIQSGGPGSMKDDKELNQQLALAYIGKSFDLIGAAGVFEVIDKMDELWHQANKGEENGN